MATKNERNGSGRRNAFVVRISIAVFVLALIGAFFALGWQRYLSFEYLKEHQSDLQDYYEKHRLLTTCVFALVMMVVAGFWGWGQVPLTILGGAIFGLFWGTVISNLAATVGDALAFLAIRYGVGPALEQRWHDLLERMRRGLNKEGAYYLFMLRIIPIVPAFAVNAGMGLTNIRLWTFCWVTQLGTLPGKFLYTNAGTQLAELESWRGIMTPSLIATFVALGLMPITIRKLLAWFRPSLFEQS